MATKLIDTIRPVAESAAAERGLYVLHCIVRGTDSRPVIEITIDGDRLVGVEDCEIVSKALQSFADEQLGQNVNYRLDVLSPGIDEPIIYDYQLKRSIGRILRISYTDDLSIREVTGRLVAFNESELTIEQEKLTSKGQSPKKLGALTVPRESITSVRQIAMIR
ncbi:MAG: hypothetical protein JSS75_05260 [Bacteroidetes bacterium]|nr:hypothetical protein [Bacteroidota bacterium]